MKSKKQEINNIIKKITIIFICICCLSVNYCVKAIEVAEDEYVTVYGETDYEQIVYDGNVLKIPISYAISSSKSFPVYCLKQEEAYVDATTGYSTTIDGVLKNEKIRQILLQGYPNCTYKELNCSSANEAYIITQIAIFDVYYNYDLSKFSVKKSNKYPNIISNMKSFIEKMRNLEVEDNIVELTIDKKTHNWQKEEDNYESKTYKILNYGEITEFTVEIKTENDEDKSKIKITNENNEIQESFNIEEKFKILVPNNEYIEFEIIVKATAETTPIKKFKEISDAWEPYIFLAETEEIKTNLIDIHYQSEEIGNIEDNKQDEELEQEDEKNNVEQKETILSFSKKQEIKKLPQTGF